MKKVFLLIFFLLLPTVVYSQPSIEFKTETHDFGTILPDDTIEHTFEFKNIGNEDLEIKRLSSS
ncbi:MAG: DUF1573 domain-containing protein [Nitrospirae bacterium]|nr:DUF1573 domain-containing protein [Nitrospirota bacterium]